MDYDGIILGFIAMGFTLAILGYMNRESDFVEDLKNALHTAPEKRKRHQPAE